MSDSPSLPPRFVGAARPNDPASLGPVLDVLWGPITAIGAAHDGRVNASIVTFAISAFGPTGGPRIVLHLYHHSLTHDLVRASGHLGLSLLHPDQLEVIHALGHQSGHDVDKLAGLSWRPSSAGAPLFPGALGTLEAQVVHAFADELATLFVADVTAQTWERDGVPLTSERWWGLEPPEWRLAHARRLALVGRPLTEG